MKMTARSHTGRVRMSTFEQEDYTDIRFLSFSDDHKQKERMQIS